MCGWTAEIKQCFLTVLLRVETQLIVDTCWRIITTHHRQQCPGGRYRRGQTLTCECAIACRAKARGRQCYGSRDLQEPQNRREQGRNTHSRALDGLRDDGVFNVVTRNSLQSQCVTEVPSSLSLEVEQR